MLKQLEILSTSLVSHEDFQRIELKYVALKSCHLKMSVYDGARVIANDMDVAFTSGKGNAFIMLPVQKNDVFAKWIFVDLDGVEVFSCEGLIKTPRDWTLYFMISSHTDIGLHNSQYVQRANSEKFIDSAMELSNQTSDRPKDEQYKYIMEGTWFWNNYPMDKGEKKARKVIDEYVKKGLMGICCGVAGNTLQTFGLEELCRFACERKALEDKWGVKCSTMTMIDNNGLPLSVIQPLSDAGIENIIFSPNQWHPINSSVWQRNLLDDTYPWNPNAGGGGSRIDFRFDSELPMVFFWQDKNGNRLLVMGSTQYDNSGVPFGIFNKPQPALINKDQDYIPYAEIKTANTLRLMEEKYDFNVYLLPCYSDDQSPNLWMTDRIKEWNEKWKYPHFAIIGNPDIPFNILRQNFADKIPVVQGDLTGAWYQLHASVVDFSGSKYEADRLLPIAEKYSTVASIIDKKYTYPKEEFDRAWNHLLYNDEHSYGASGYRGRRVYETWLQHRDWLEKSKLFAKEQIDKAINSICAKIDCQSDGVVAFNPTNTERVGIIKIDGGKKYKKVNLPKFGYKVIEKTEFNKNESLIETLCSPPIIENENYKIAFATNGAITSIYDKALEKELVDQNNAYRVNEFIYTKDNHKTYTTQNNGATFLKVDDCDGQTIIVKTALDALGAEIVQKITLSSLRKEILISNEVLHANDMYNLKTKQEYLRYLYIAFPFKVDNAKRLCHLNGAVAEYAKDVTGHCTDVYMAMHDWCAIYNGDYGVGLMAKETQLVEFDHIHPDKSDFGNAGKGSQLFCYLANDWLQMHVSGGSELNYTFSYAITSYNGDYEKAGICGLAENFITPIHTAEIHKQSGQLPKIKTFFDFEGDARFITLKPSSKGDGVIARFYGQEKSVDLMNHNVQRVTVDERIYNGEKRRGFYTYKISGYKIKFNKREKIFTSLDKPLPIGSHYTGLVDKPKAVSGEKDGQIYLLWGKNRERNLSHYELYRGETEDFKVNKKSFVSKVYPEQFVVGRYVDEGLKTNHRYYYKVRAVNKKGVKGPLSFAFSAKTKELVK